MKSRRLRPLGTGIILAVLFVILFFSLFEISLRLIYGKKLDYETDEELYWKLKPSQKGYPGAYLPKAKINSEGFRGDELEIKKCNVMILGDSYAFGWGIKDNETFSHILNSKMEKIQFINTAHPGWGPFQFNRIFERTYDHYNPDLVIIWLIEKDLIRAPFNDSKAEKRFLVTSKIRNTYSFLSFIPFLKNIINSAFDTKLGMPQNMEYFYPGENLSALWDFQSKYIEEIADILRRENKELILILYPSIGSAAKTQEFYNLDWELLGQNIRIINNLDSDFEMVPGSQLEISKYDTHPTALAHEIAAKRVYQELQRMPSFTNKGCLS